MEQYYIVEVSYPDGHVEEIEETFNKGLDALEYGKNMLAQITQTEQFHADGEKKEPYFVILVVKGKKRTIAFDSRY